MQSTGSMIQGKNIIENKMAIYENKQLAGEKQNDPTNEIIVDPKFAELYKVLHMKNKCGLKH